jgi:predicted acylesterase/phospholipase RssA
MTDTCEKLDPRDPQYNCDLVLKGGIASTVVYPPLIHELAQKYRFRNIGGTSAGAIGATLAAAAELGREQGSFDSDSTSANRLEARQQIVRETEGFAHNLFQPEPRAAPLFHTLLDFVTSKPGTAENPARPVFPGYITFLPRLTRSFARHDPRVFLPVLIVGVLVWWFLLNAGLPVWGRGLGALFLGWIMALVAGIGHMAYILQVPVRQNFHGICTGRTVPGRKEDGLIDWMHETLNIIAGRDVADGPLTFAELDAHTVCGTKHPINLQMVTANLSHNQPYILPFRVTGFLFKEDEMLRLFPKDVVEYMKGNIPLPKDVVEYMKSNIPPQSRCHDLLKSRAWLPHDQPVALGRLDGSAVDGSIQVSLAELNKQLGAGRGFYFLPPGDALPVLVAMRMSLSFPLLFSAVPLWSISIHAFKQQTDAADTVYNLTEADLQRHWFIDGGVASNFPIHFFDAWVPRWPTFAVNLTPNPREAFVRPGSGEKPGRVEQALGQLAERIGGAETHPASISVLNLVAGAQVGPQGPVLGAATRGTTPEGEQALQEMTHEDEDVFLLRPTEEMAPVWQDITSLGGIINAIRVTMQDYRDTTQAMLPGYRERIVHIRLDASKGEGGINLNMPLSTIAKIDQKGRDAAGILINEFNFEAHRWIRFRVLMAELEQRIKRMRDRLAAPPNEGTTTNDTTSACAVTEPASDDAASQVKEAVESAAQTVALYAQMLRANSESPYPLDADDIEEACNRLEALYQHLTKWGNEEECLFSKDPPLPESVLRVTPDL